MEVVRSRAALRKAFGPAFAFVIAFLETPKTLLPLHQPNKLVASRNDAEEASPVDASVDAEAAFVVEESDMALEDSLDRSSLGSLGSLDSLDDKGDSFENSWYSYYCLPFLVAAVCQL